MNVHVRLSPGLAKEVGTARLTIRLADGATVADLLAQLRTEYPSLTNGLETAMPFIAGRHALQTEQLSAGQEIALLTPIAGG